MCVCVCAHASTYMNSFRGEFWEVRWVQIVRRGRINLSIYIYMHAHIYMNNISSLCVCARVSCVLTTVYECVPKWTCRSATSSDCGPLPIFLMNIYLFIYIYLYKSVPKGTCRIATSSDCGPWQNWYIYM